MSRKPDVAAAVWDRYRYLRDNGHTDFLRKAHQCDDFFRGLQWAEEDLKKLRKQKRPALTINKILATIANVMGEQIYNRSEIAFRPRSDQATDDVADLLTKTFMQVSDNNHLPWLRSDVFADGVITSRGFLQTTIDFTDNIRGEVRIRKLNAKHVLVDTDADQYDPDTWSDVMHTMFMSLDQIESLFGKPAANYFKEQPTDWFGDDGCMERRDRLGVSGWISTPRDAARDESTRRAQREIRVIYHEKRVPTKMDHFVDNENGDTRPVPGNWTAAQIEEYKVRNPSVVVMPRTANRIRWTVVAGDWVFHDEWSAYDHLSIIPFFPFFRHGTTIGLVENLLDPQQLLNKTRSQELHVVNTTANSGWKLKAGSLKNMTLGQLEEQGAQSGLVMELLDPKDAEKIVPNQVPSGLDRIGYLAEESIKSISGVTDYQTGNAREDVSAKALASNQQAGSANLASVLDNLSRTDAFLARNVLECVQKFDVGPRLLRTGGPAGDVMVNVEDPVTKAITNDLTIGEYGVVVSSQPERETYEDSQFEQASAMRKDLGVAIDDETIIMASRLRDKNKILEKMAAKTQSPEAQAQAALAQRGAEAEVQKVEAEAMEKQAKAQSLVQGAGKDSLQAERERLEQELQIELIKLEQQQKIAEQKLQNEFQLAEMKITLQAQIDERQNQRTAQIQRVAAATAPPKEAAA